MEAWKTHKIEVICVSVLVDTFEVFSVLFRLGLAIQKELSQET
jgi:hypothetical protein